nr:MAG TPA: hypothetical protein [Bacteriophage sp.]
MSYMDNLKYSDIENKRLNNIEKNYKRLMENYTPVNAIKYCEYLRNKDKHELVNNFECLYTVPSKAAWDIVDALFEELFIDKDYTTIDRLHESIQDYKQLCLENNQVSSMEYIDRTINLVKESYKPVLTNENMVSYIMESFIPTNDESLNESVKSYVESTVNALFPDGIDDNTIMENLSTIETIDNKVRKLAESYIATKETFKTPVYTTEDRDMGIRRLISGVPIGNLTKALRETTFKGDQDLANDIIDAAEIDHNKIIHSNKYEPELYNDLEDKVDSLIDLVKSSVHDKDDNITDELEEYKKTIESIIIDANKNKTSYNIWKENGEELLDSEDDTDEDVSDNDIIEAIDDLADMIEEDDVLLERVILEYQAHRKNLIDKYEVTKETIYPILKSLDKIQSIYEDTGRNSLAGKVGRMKEKVARQVVSGARKTRDALEHGAIASQKAAEHVNNFASSTVQKILDAPYKEKREEILKGGYKVKLTNLVKDGIRHGIAFAINPVLGAISVLSKVANDAAVDMRVRREILQDLKMELKMVEEKIEDARSDGNKKEKYQLMRTKQKLENEITRIENRIESRGTAERPE